MRNTFGNNVTVTLFGESHGEIIGAVLDGLEAGTPIDFDLIKLRLSQRRGLAEISTSRREEDNFKIVSGTLNGVATGTPICVLIRNENVKSSDYESIKHTPRPSHADYTHFIKYGGFNDSKGGGHTSGRLTAPLVAVGAICEGALKNKGIHILTHIKRCAGITDTDFENPEKDENLLNCSNFPVLNKEIGEKMKAEIQKAKKEKDSLGGVLETAVYGLPVGIGEPWFDSLESVISHAVFSVPGIKGIEFGAGFALGEMHGSRANDEMEYKDGKVRFLSNNNGGILGGVSNGDAIVFRCAVKPTPSIEKKQRTVNTSTGENTSIEISGRHDPFIAHKASAAVTAVTAIALSDMLSIGG